MVFILMEHQLPLCFDLFTLEELYLMVMRLLSTCPAAGNCELIVLIGYNVYRVRSTFWAYEFLGSYSKHHLIISLSHL